MSSNSQFLLLDKNEYDGLRDATLSINAQNNQADQFSYAENMTFSGRAAALIKTELIDTNDLTKFLVVEFFDGCCNTQTPFFRGRFGINNISFCIDQRTQTVCDYRVNLQSSMAIDAFVACLKNKTVAQTVPFENTHYIRARVENRPFGLQMVVLIMVSLIKLTFAPLLTILRLTGLRGIVRLLDNFVIPAHNLTGFFIVDALRDACTACGGGFVADTDLFGGQLEKLFRIDTPNRPNGTSEQSNRKAWFLNAPNITILELLDSLNNANVAYTIGDAVDTNGQITPNVLRLHKKTDTPTGDWIDTTARAGDIVSICLDGTDAPIYAGLNVEYQLDGVEKHGDELKRMFERLLDFNTPVNPLLRGIETRTIPYALLRSFADNYGGSAIMEFQAIANTNSISNFFLGLNFYERVAMISQDTFIIPKLAIVQTRPTRRNAELFLQNAVGYSSIQTTGGNQDFIHDYQLGLQMHKPRQNTIKTLFTTQFETDNPRNTALNVPFDFTIIMQSSCADIANFIKSNQRLVFAYNNQIRTGRVNTVEINLYNGQMTIKGTC